MPTDQEFDELNCCRILPLADGSLGTLRILDPSTTSDRYYLANNREMKLFDFAAGLLTSRKTGDLLKQVLVKSGKSTSIDYVYPMSGLYWTKN
jgi:sacsin